MTTEDLITVLKQYPNNTPVLISIDEEGNGFHHLIDISDQYIEDSSDTYEPDVYSEEDLDDGDGVPYGFRKVVVLWP